MTGGERLAGRVALVTGAGSGLGRAVAERFVREGARVAIAELDGARALEAAAALGEAGIGVQCGEDAPIGVVEVDGSNILRRHGLRGYHFR